MTNFEKKEKQIQEICDRVRNSNSIDAELKLAHYDIMKVVRMSFYEGYDAGVKKLSEINEKNQEQINNLFKN